MMLLFHFFVSVFRLITKVTAFDSQELCDCFAAGDNFYLRRILHVEEDVFMLKLQILLFVHL
jgi:hypothetical protein